MAKEEEDEEVAGAEEGKKYDTIKREGISSLLIPTVHVADRVISRITNIRPDEYRKFSSVHILFCRCNILLM